METIESNNNFEQNIENFVKNNPFPSYEEIENKLQNNCFLYAEYSKFCHKCTQTIYENPTNKQTILEMGKRLHRAAGDVALLTCCQILRNYSPYKDSHDIDIRSQARILEFYFAEVSPTWLP